MNILKAIGKVSVYIIFFLCTWVINFIICGVIGSLYYDGTNEAVGVIYGFTMLLIPAIASTLETLAFCKKWKGVQHKTQNTSIATPPQTNPQSGPVTDSTHAACPNVDQPIDDNMRLLKSIIFILLKIAAFAFVWFISVFLVAILGALLNVSTESTLYAFALLTIPLVFAGVSMDLKSWNRVRAKINSIQIRIAPPITPSSKDAAIPSANNFNLSYSRKKRIETVQALTSEANYEYGIALKATSPMLFVAAWDTATSAIVEIERYRGTIPDHCFSNVPTKTRLEKDFQWKLRDSMERSIKVAVTDMKGEYHNNKKGRFSDYLHSFECYSERYDEESLDFARSAVTEVAKAAGIHRFTFCKEDIAINPVEAPRNAIGTENFDFMEGHEFEHWCAKLLSDIGYANVNVTQGSGDQGVDIVAQKDGIRYAIQCKCYSKDLGNSPIQEVVSGRTIYHCQIGAVMTNRYFTKGAQEAAAANGVLLWDRDWITKAVEKRNRS